jgi:hypothetical protein
MISKSTFTTMPKYLFYFLPSSFLSMRHLTYFLLSFWRQVVAPPKLLIKRVSSLPNRPNISWAISMLLGLFVFSFTASAQTETHTYKTPFQVTELNDVPIVIPKFNKPGCTLTKVELSYGIREGTNLLIENTAATSGTFRATVSMFGIVSLGGNQLLGEDRSFNTGSITLPAGVSVPAQGTYPGDLPNAVTGALTTLDGMSSWLDAYMSDIFVDPRTDPRWVTNATGNATDDDDIYVMPVQTFTVDGVSTYTTASDLAQFIGTGQLPLTASTLNGIGFQGAAGNLISPQKTKAEAYATVTYTYICNAVCTLDITATSGACVPATNLYDVTGNITFANAPATGTLTVSVGGQQQVFNAPFTSPQAYTITGLTLSLKQN